MYLGKKDEKTMTRWSDSVRNFASSKIHSLILLVVKNTSAHKKICCSVEAEKS